MPPAKFKTTEIVKWVVYLGMPIIATIHVLDPDRLDNLIMKHQFVVYPPEAQSQEEFRKKELEHIERRKERLKNESKTNTPN